MTQDTCILDAKDRRLLAALQEDATLTAQALAERVHLSPSQAARRRARLEAAGVIAGYAARLDAARLGLGVQAFIRVIMAAHSAEASQGFARLLAGLPEVVHAWTLTGEADYLLQVWCEDLAGLNRLVQDRLLPHPAVARVQSQIVMEQLKRSGALPV